MRIKSEEREKRKNNNRKMIVRGRSIFTLQHIINEKAIEASKKLNK